MCFGLFRSVALGIGVLLVSTYGLSSPGKADAIDANGLICAVGSCSETESFALDTGSTSTSASVSDTLTFDLFNPLLGTLTGVSVDFGNTSYVGSLSGQGIDFTPPNDGPVDAQATSTNTADVSDILGSSGNVRTSNLDGSCSSTDPFCSIVGNLLDVDDTNGDLLSLVLPGLLQGAFSGPGTFDITVEASASLDSCTSIVNGNFVSWSTQTIWNGDITVAYLFDPADTTEDPVAIPEPATLAAFGIGLLGLGIVRRRRRR